MIVKKSQTCSDKNNGKKLSPHLRYKNKTTNKESGFETAVEIC